jgi:LacI family transcriptional regulator, gluconate utilization system Gnt-I transcriptional repressor
MQKPGRKRRGSALSRQKRKRSIPRDADAISNRGSRSSPAAVAATTDRPKVVTITDVARKARVGESTVSRVLRNQGSVSQQTREKILKAAADLNYVPNRIAGALASMTSKLIGIVIPSVGNTVVPEVLAGVNTVLENAGF